MKSNDRDKLDSIIEDALSGYSATDPLAGIEQRVLQRISLVEAGRRGSRILGWAAAFPILISVLVLAISVRLPQRTPPGHTSSGPPRLASGQRMLPGMTAVAAQRRSRSVIRHLSPLRSAKQEPITPATPITAEERSLVALITRDPAETTQAFAELQKRSVEPIDIQEIQIQPLQNSAAQSGSAQ